MFNFHNNHRWSIFKSTEGSPNIISHSSSLSYFCILVCKDIIFIILIKIGLDPQSSWGWHWSSFRGWQLLWILDKRFRGWKLLWVPDKRFRGWRLLVILREHICIFRPDGLLKVIPAKAGIQEVFLSLNIKKKIKNEFLFRLVTTKKKKRSKHWIPNQVGDDSYCGSSIKDFEDDNYYGFLNSWFKEW